MSINSITDESESGKGEDQEDREMQSCTRLKAK